MALLWHRRTRQRSRLMNPSEQKRPFFSSSTGARGSRYVRNENGQNLIEFALISPLIIVFLAAIVVFGLAMSTRSSLQQSVREGARKAAVGATLTEVQNLAAGNAPDSIDPGDVRVCHPTGPSGTRGRVGDPVMVYLFQDGGEGHPYTLVNADGIFNAFNVPPLVVRISPRATARLERSVTSPVICP